MFLVTNEGGTVKWGPLGRGVDDNLKHSEKRYITLARLRNKALSMAQLHTHASMGEVPERQTPKCEEVCCLAGTLCIYSLEPAPTLAKNHIIVIITNLLQTFSSLNK